MVEPGNLSELTGALIGLLTNTDLRHQFGSNAYQRALLEFDVRKSVDQLLQLYDRYGLADNRSVK